jgi:hypothetical protein
MVFYYSPVKKRIKQLHNLQFIFLAHLAKGNVGFCHHLKIFFKSANQKQELPVVAMFVNRSGQNEHYLGRTFHRCFLPSFTSLG